MYMLDSKDVGFIKSYGYNPAIHQLEPAQQRGKNLLGTPADPLVLVHPWCHSKSLTKNPLWVKGFV